MKILQIINNFSHTSIPVEMAEKMALYNEVDILSLYDSQVDAKTMGNIYATHCKRIIGCDFKHHPIKAIYKLKILLNENNYDIVQSHHSLSAALTSFFEYRKNNRKEKLVNTIHGNSHSYTFKQNIITTYVINKMDGIIYNSKTTKEEMFEWQKKKIRKTTKEQVIYNGIDTDRIKNVNLTFGHDFRRNYGIPQDAKILIQIGRLEPVKNPKTALIAFERYLLSNKNDLKTYFVFVGDGSIRGELEEYVRMSAVLKARVLFTGTLKRDNVYSLLNVVDFQIIPSKYEGFCNALFESLIIGNQIIASDISVFRELIIKLDGLVLFNPNDVDNVAKAIFTAIKRPITEKNREDYQTFAHEKFDINICADNYIKFYKKVMSR